jgi:hypothetical protein
LCRLGDAVEADGQGDAAACRHRHLIARRKVQHDLMADRMREADPLGQGLVIGIEGKRHLGRQLVDGR